MRLPRFTVRRLMVLVGLSAVLFGLNDWMRHRSAAFRLKNEKHFLMWTAYPPNSRTPKSEYHRQMTSKYWEAARRPWLPVAPDPPEPK